VRRELTSATRELTSETCELTSETCELTSAARELTSVAWRVHMNRRRVPIGTVEVISERYGVPARREEALDDQRVVADERRCVPAMGEDVPVARQSVNRARRSAPGHRGDVSDGRASVARERPVVAIARTEGMTRRWSVTARSDDVTGRRRELPTFADDLAAGVCEVPPIEDGVRSRLWMKRAGNGHAGGGVRVEITVRGVSTIQIVAARETGALDRKTTSDPIVLILA
jgi:hypothetical protein